MNIEILDYSKKEEVLFVSLGTKYIWNYTPVTQKMFKKLQGVSGKEREKEFITMIRNSFLTGSIKEVDNE